MLYLATYLSNIGHEVKVYDFWQKKISWQKLSLELDNFDPRVIGFNVHTEAYEITLDLTRRLRRRYRDAVIVWGGAFPTFTYQEILRLDEVDYVVRYEGEIAFQNLLRHIAQPRAFPIEQIAGVAYRRNGGMIANQREKPIEDLNTLPIPERDFLSLEEYEFPLSISTTRGCPSACTFCSARAYWPGRVRYRSAENIFQEVMALYQKYELFQFVIVDDTFTASPDRTIKFCQLLLETGIPFVWSCESRADVARADMLEIMYRAGCREIQFGIESASDDILRRLGKGVRRSQITEAFRLAHEIGFYSIGSYILGHPWDTLETMKQTLEYVFDLRDRYQVAVYGSTNTPFPGCYQYDRADQLGIKIHAKSWGEFRLNNPIISTPNFSLDQLREIFFYSQELTGS
jgi:radical SAM superfamily enzyme YgiQ (UPF0313 family)